MPAARIIPEITKVESRAGASYQLSRRRHSSGRVYDFAIEDDEPNAFEGGEVVGGIPLHDEQVGQPAGFDYAPVLKPE